MAYTTIISGYARTKVWLERTYFYVIEFRNNIFHAPAGSYPTLVKLENNLYYPHTAPSQDIKGINLDPMFSDPGQVEEGLNSVDGYKIPTGSPAIAAGMFIGNNGGRDFWEASLPAEGNPDIGAGQFVLNTVVMPSEVQKHKMNLYLQPNPFKDFMTIQYQVSKATRVSIRIFDSAGKFVTSLVEENTEQGRYNTVWYGKNDSGVSMAPGVYYCCFQTSYMKKVLKIICR